MQAYYLKAITRTVVRRSIKSIMKTEKSLEEYANTPGVIALCLANSFEEAAIKLDYLEMKGVKVTAYALGLALKDKPKPMPIVHDTPLQQRIYPAWMSPRLSDEPIERD